MADLPSQSACRMTTRSIVFVLLLPALLGACADLTPRPGDLTALRISRQVTEEWYRHGRMVDIGNALAQGVNEPEIEAGRLAVVTCAQPEREPFPETRWVVRLPAQVSLRRGDTLAFRPGARYGSTGPLGEFVMPLPPTDPADLHAWKYGTTVRCARRDDSGTMQASFAFAFGKHEVREYRRHMERMRGVDLPEVLAGQVFIGTCSRLSDGWTDWTVRVPASLGVKVGDHVVASAGTPDDEPGSDLSVGVRKIDSPRPDQTYAVQGSRIIRCNAVPGAG